MLLMQTATPTLAPSAVDVASFLSMPEGHKSLRFAEFYAAMNSMLRFCTCFLRIHFVVEDDRSGIFASSVTKKLSQHLAVNISTHVHKLDVTPIVTQKNHRFGRIALAKAFPDEIFRSNLSKVIIFDIDTLWVSDVCELFKEFNNFNESNALGLAPEMGDWYIKFGNQKYHNEYYHIPSDHKNRYKLFDGLNSGIIFADINKLASLKWSTTVRAFFQNESKTIILADQDVYNNILFENSHLVYVLPASYNWQLGSNTIPMLGEQNDLLPAVYHGNNYAFTFENRQICSVWYLFAPDNIRSYGIGKIVSHIEPKYLNASFREEALRQFSNRKSRAAFLKAAAGISS